MSNLPKSIIVVSIKHFNGYSHVIRILKKFFEGIPHIEYRDCNLDSNITYYIFTANYLVYTFISKLYDDLNIPDILGCDEYDYREKYSLILHTYIPCNYTWTINEQDLPDSIKIDPNDVEKLESLKEN